MVVSERQKFGIDKQQSPQQFSTDYGVIPNGRLNAYLRRGGREVAARSHRPQSPFFFRSVNAYAFPGGSVAATRERYMDETASVRRLKPILDLPATGQRGGWQEAVCPGRAAVQTSAQAGPGDYTALLMMAKFQRGTEMATVFYLPVWFDLFQNLLRLIISPELLGQCQGRLQPKFCLVRLVILVIANT